MKTNENDDHDAEAIAEAATQPTMRFVPVKSEAQSDIQALHRARSRLAAERRALINHLRAEWRSLDERTAAFDAGCVRMVRDDGMSRRLSTILGIAVVNATALVAAVGHAASLGRGGDRTAWLGLTPRQATTGGKTQAAGISKCGNRYLRANLIHGTRAAQPPIMVQDTPLGRWARGLSSGRTRASSSSRGPPNSHASFGRCCAWSAASIRQSRRRKN